MIREVYERWDIPEDSTTAFENVKNGNWDEERFYAWYLQVCDEEIFKRKI